MKKQKYYCKRIIITGVGEIKCCDNYCIPPKFIAKKNNKIVLIKTNTFRGSCFPVCDICYEYFDKSDAYIQITEEEYLRYEKTRILK